MPSRTRKELEQSLKKGQIEPVYFLYGAESYLRDQAVRDITEAALRGSNDAWRPRTCVALAGSDSLTVRARWQPRRARPLEVEAPNVPCDSPSVAEQISDRGPKTAATSKHVPCINNARRAVA